MAVVNQTFQWKCDRDGALSAVMAGTPNEAAVIPAGWVTGLGLQAPSAPSGQIDDLCNVCAALSPEQWIIP